MNNEQFRRLLLDQKTGSQNVSGASPKASSTPSTLGSRKSAFVPMTPRTVGRGGAGVDFARQMAERNAGSQPTKKFKTSGPKGAKLASGYTDRALSRMAAEDEDGDENEEKDDRSERIQALEEQVKLGQLEYSVFEKIRDQITGGKVDGTHLVKGLDRQLLNRVRRGEDVMGLANEAKEEQSAEVDEEFEELEEKDVAPVEKEKVVKKGEMAPPQPPSVAGAKRSRDTILAELKAQRQAAAAERAAARPDLGANFRSIDQPRNGTKVIRDHKGREVLITRDEHGNIKKKVRKVTADTTEKAPVADKPVKYLDADVHIPQLKQAPKVEEEVDSDDDIFTGAGSSYNPLPEDEDDEDEDEDDEDENEDETAINTAAANPSISPGAEESKDGTEEGEIPSAPPSASPQPPPTTESNPDLASTSMPPPPLPRPSTTTEPNKPRNYFKNPAPSPATPSAPQNPMSDPTFLAAIKRAGSLATFKMHLDSSSSSTKNPNESEAEAEARLKKRAAMLATSDRDLEDMDLGFGESRFGDEEEEEGGEGGKKVKLSEWKGLVGGDDDNDAEDGRGGAGGKKGRKDRGSRRKRKGDKDSAKDVLGVLERRKEAESK